MDIGPMPRQRKRARASSGGDLEVVLERCDAMLAEAAPDACTLWLAVRRLQQLQASAERRLAGCPVDGLTPHDAVEYIYRKRVRLARIVRNDFEEEDSSGSEEGAAARAGEEDSSGSEEGAA